MVSAKAESHRAEEGRLAASVGAEQQVPGLSQLKVEVFKCPNVGKRDPAEHLARGLRLQQRAGLRRVRPGDVQQSLDDPR